MTMKPQLFTDLVKLRSEVARIKASVTLLEASGDASLVALGDELSGDLTLLAARIKVLEDAAPFDHTPIEAGITENADDIDDLMNIVNGAVLETIAITVINDGGTAKLQLEQSGGGELTFFFGNEKYILPTVPATEVSLSAGTDVSPNENFVYVTESSRVLTLAANTTGWPSTPHAPIATVLVPTAATLGTYGAYKVHAWTDHLFKATENGHLQHINRKLRALAATWISGCAAGDMTTSNPDAYLSLASGTVFQLHPHTMPAIDMNGAHAFLVNDPTTANLLITSLDDITQDSTGNTSINNKYMNIVMWGVVSEATGDCQMMLNLPSGVYTVEANAQSDVDNYANYTIPAEYTGVGFLIARYTLQAKTSGLWVQSKKTDLRGLQPSTSPGTGGTGASSPLTTLGDLFTYSTTDARKAIGSDGEILTPDSSDSVGLAYIPASPASFLDLCMTKPGLRGLWTFGSVDGSGDLLDVSGNGRTLTMQGNPTYDAPATGMYSYGNLDGTGDYWSRADEAGLDIIGTEAYIGAPGMTFFAWAQFSSIAATRVVAAKSASSDTAFTLHYNSGAGYIRGAISQNGTTTFTVDSILPVVDTWYFMVIRFVPSTSLDIYVDGTKYSNTTSIPSSLKDSAGPFHLGASNSGSALLPGLISTSGLYASALTDDFIDKLWNTSKYLYGKN